MYVYCSAGGRNEHRVHASTSTPSLAKSGGHNYDVITINNTSRYQAEETSLYANIDITTTDCLVS